MKLNLIGPFVVNAPFGTEIAFSKGLKQTGHEVFEIDPNIDKEMVGLRNDADATVVFKSCVGAEKYLRSLTHPIIVYQPDDARFPHIREMIAMMRQYADLLLSFDEYGANVAKMMGYRGAETLLLTADPDLYCPPKPGTQRDIDVSFVGSLNGPVSHASRRRMCQLVGEYAAKQGLVCWFGETYFTNSNSPVEVYQRSKVVINHATDVGQDFGTGFGLQCRHFEVGMTNTCLLSNHILNDIPRRPQGFYTFATEKGLIETLHSLLNDTVVSYAGGRHELPLWYLGAQDLHADVMWKHQPRHRAEQLVDFIKRHS